MTASFPPPPLAGIDWAKIDISCALSTNGHVETRHSKGSQAWTLAKLVEDDRIPVSGLSPGLNYGQQCYEGLKAFRSKSGEINVFRPQFHAARMAKSAAALCLPAPPEWLFIECVRKAIASNAEHVPPAESDAYLYIRPLLFGSSATLALGPPEETIFAVYVCPIRAYHGSEAIGGMVLDEFDRSAPQGMGAYKVGGNYAPVWRHVAKAKELGFGITLHLDSAEKKFVEEFSTSAFLGHKMRGTQHVLAAPRAQNAIASVSRDSLVQLAREAGWIVEEEALEFSLLAELDEVIAVGTAAAAVPVRSITRPSTDQVFDFAGAGRSLLGLAKQLSEVQRGRTSTHREWLHEIKRESDIEGDDKGIVARPNHVMVVGSLISQEA